MWQSKPFFSMSRLLADVRDVESLANGIIRDADHIATALFVERRSALA